MRCSEIRLRKLKLRLNTKIPALPSGNNRFSRSWFFGIVIPNKLKMCSISVLSFDRFRIREAVVCPHSGVNYFVFPLQGPPTAKITAAVKTRRERFPSPTSIAAEYLWWLKLNLDLVITPKEETFCFVGCQTVILVVNFSEPVMAYVLSASPSSSSSSSSARSQPLSNCSGHLAG